MSPEAKERRRSLTSELEPHELELELEEEELDEEERAEERAEEAREDERVGGFAALLQDRRKLATGFGLFVVLVVGIYILFPKLVGLDDSLAKLDEATWYWVVVGLLFMVVQFAAYVALFRGVLGGTGVDEVRRRLDVRASYEI